MSPLTVKSCVSLVPGALGFGISVRRSSITTFPTAREKEIFTFLGALFAIRYLLFAISHALPDSPKCRDGRPSLIACPTCAARVLRCVGTFRVYHCFHATGQCR